MLALRTTPGIYVDVRTPLEPEPLPRMDIALFAGFASDGPLGKPVPVESVAGYEQIFGEADLELGRLGNDAVRAYLGSAVRAFFRNGGKRCWILRLAWGEFFDQRLVNHGVETLMNQANHLLYSLNEDHNPLGAALKGIHAALAETESSIFSVPDATYIGWKMSAKPQEDPSLESVPRTVPPPDESVVFSVCNPRKIAPPVLTGERVAEGILLHWTGDGNHILEESEDASFLTPAVIYSGPRQTILLRTSREQIRFYRVGDSNTLKISWPPGPLATLEPPATDADRLELHRQMLRICAARGDTFAVLSLPNTMHEEAAEVYGHSLAALLAVESQVRSYGALYHPWLTGREENSFDELTTSPPDGAIAGVIANRSFTRGAWIAPANEPLRGVIAIEPEIKAALDLVNVIEQKPAGFLVMSEITLSADPDFPAIHVRRLMMLLRRLVLREGVEYVFEPNNETFRRTVQRGFERMLERLFVLGAFAGQSPRRAFQVSTDNPLNTPRLQDIGQFIVELKVAPAREMQFIVLRLVQTADRLLLTEGA